MIEVVSAGAGWNVTRDGVLIQEGDRSGVHVTKGSAARHAYEIVENTGEQVELEGGDEGADLEHYLLK